MLGMTFLPAIDAVMAIASHASSSTSTSEDATHHAHLQRHRVLLNSETGIIIHPLIPHEVHLERRRLELQRTPKHNGNDFDFDALLLSPRSRPSKSRHSQKDNNLRKLQQLQRTTTMGPLYQGYGTHYIDLWVGSPNPQRQTVIVDTASDVTAFPCEECKTNKGCGGGKKYHTDDPYQQSQSDTFRVLTCDECVRGECDDEVIVNGLEEKRWCGIRQSFNEGSSWDAYEAVDVCYPGGLHNEPLAISQETAEGEENDNDLEVYHNINPLDASQHAFELAFGCQVHVTGKFIYQLADGIMGMENAPTAFWNQMHRKKAIPRAEFSLCFRPASYMAKATERKNEHPSPNGALTLGGYDRRLHSSPMVFAKNVNKEQGGFYTVHLKAVYLRDGGGTSAQITQEDMRLMHKLEIDEEKLNMGGVILDSGTTDTHLVSALVKPYRKAWEEITGSDRIHATLSLSEEELDEMPTIILVLSGYHDGEVVVGDEPNGDPNDIAGYAGSTAKLSDNPRDVILAIPAKHYMEYDAVSNVYHPRVLFEEDPSGGSILGANAMMGHDVHFDIERGRIGFAESDCDYASLLESEGFAMSEKQTLVDQPGNSEITHAESGINKQRIQGKGESGNGSTIADLPAEMHDDLNTERESKNTIGTTSLLLLVVMIIVIATACIHRSFFRRRPLKKYRRSSAVDVAPDLIIDINRDNDKCLRSRKRKLVAGAKTENVHIWNLRTV